MHHAARLVTLTIDAEGHVVDASLPDSSSSDDMRECILTALANETFPCVSGRQVLGECPMILL